MMNIAVATIGRIRPTSFLRAAFCSLLFCAGAWSQVPAPPPPDDAGPANFDGPSGGRMGGPGPRQKIDLLKQFDKDGDKRLDSAERKAAREFLHSEQGRGRRGPRFQRQNTASPE